MSVSHDALYDGYITWATHFSIVRLTMATFMVTTSLGILGFDKKSSAASKAMISVICGMSGMVFAWATHRECLYVQKQNELVGNPLGTWEFYLHDLPIWTVGIYIAATLAYTLLFWKPEEEIAETSTTADAQDSQ